MEKQAIKTQGQVRAAFWAAFPDFKRIIGKRQNEYCANIRMSFVDFVDDLQRNGFISKELAQRITL